MVQTPDTWTCENENKRVKVEVFGQDPNIVEDFEAIGQQVPDNEWIEIPTSKVEVVVNEDGQADINRYARVDFPTEWDSRSVVQYVHGYNPQDSKISFVRIWMKDSDDNYVLEHFGFAGGVGPTSNLGTSKMWVYDINELIKAVPASFSFKNPTPMEVLNKVTEEMNKIVGVMLNPVFIPPNTGDEVTQFVTDALNGRRDINQFSLLPYGILEQDEITDEQADELQENFESLQVGTTGVDFNISVRQLDFDVTLNQRVFQPNRDTLVDVLNWLSERLTAKWHIEPFSNGGRIVMDIQPTARSFVQDDVIVDFATGEISEAGFDQTIATYTDDEGRLPVHNAIRLIKNNALADILPQTAVIVRGETSASIGDNLEVHAGNIARNMTGLNFADQIENRLIQRYDLIPNARQPSRRYPEARARIEPFFQRAKALGNESTIELTSAIVESDDRTLKGVERTAKAELAERAKEVGEGEVEMFGSPHLMPYDRLLTFPTCNTLVPSVAVPPIAYRVSQVRHVAHAGKEYRTIASVSIFVGQEEITVNSEMIDIND